MKKFLVPITILAVIIIGIFLFINNNQKSQTIPDTYFVKVIMGAGEITDNLYIYVENSYETNYSFIESTATTKSWGSSEWVEKIVKQGKLKNIDEAIKKADEYGGQVILNEDTLNFKKGDIISTDDLYSILLMNSTDIMVKKPMIYLYPENPQQIAVSLGKPEFLTHTYPKYVDRWNVFAEPDGTLTDSTGRKYYGLYWEGTNPSSKPFTEGFCVKSEDTISFLEEKLLILGLNEREANEFIVYWLPQLESNPYNLVRFMPIEEINDNMPLYIEPQPETIIRVVMEYTPLDEKVEIQEQKLIDVKRSGYTAVEWGGIRLER